MSTDGTGPEPTTERWVYGGSRVQEGKRTKEWVRPDGYRMRFAVAGSYTVGSVYKARVSYEDNVATLYGRPTYTGDQCDDKGLCDDLWARHRGAEVALTLIGKERAAKREDPVEQAIDRLVGLAARVPASQRTTFAMYVAARVAGALATR